MPLFRRDEALGLTFRAGDLAELQRSTHELAIEAVGDGRFEDAAALAAYLLEEALEPQEAFTEWAAMLPAFLLERGAAPEKVAAEEIRIHRLVAGTERFDFAAGWARYRGEVEEIRRLCAARDGAAADLVATAARHWREDHDIKCDIVCELLALVPRFLSEQAVVDFWDRAMAVWYPNYRRFALAAQPWEVSRGQLVDMAVLALRGHMPGAGRGGAIAIRDEGDAIALEFAPCGSGGRTFDTAPDGTPPRVEPPYGHRLVEGRHDWAWNRPGVCLYCTHCCRLGQQKAIEVMGFPARVVTPPVWPQDRDKAVCTWRIYKDPSAVPQSAYRDVGATPPENDEP
ncbi:hypothetical protein [Acuticoccus mangrovi]|uniref:Uncharacterized protein n=1 Tax=Acuticoccus mangrovi TaxID=2796142 RepID=A0A934ITT6_9HYPH|nr:hypothetical protein [Acuticoccus mangrovi]MBJ3778478.1 hypothetical protein [Acuticoccus mangrovi]